MLTSLSFPSDPVNGAVSGDYTYDAAKGAWRKNAALPVSVTHSDVAPSNPREGDQWWKSDEGTLFTYYNDGSSSQWVESTNVVANVEPNPIPAGAMMAWASDTIPSNWLLCDGSAVSRSTYASLFAAIGTQYGSGDGTTTFNLPDIKGRTIVGKDASQTEFDVLGETGGAKTHTLLISEMPSHTHLQDSHTHTQNSHTHTQNSHNHTQNAHTHPNAGGGYAALISFTASGGNSAYMGQGAFGAGGATWAGSLTATNNATTATNQATTATNQATTATNQNTGGGEAHNNLQPYIVLNYIIKTSAGITSGDSELATRVGVVENQNNLTPMSYNYVINGAFDIWQRGTSFSSAGLLYSADRWTYWRDAYASGITASRQNTGDTINLPASKYCLRIARNSGNTGTGLLYTNQPLTNDDSTTLIGKTVTLSAWIRVGANFSGSSVNMIVRSGTGTDQPVNNMTGAVTVAGGPKNATQTWQRYTVTGAVPANATQVGIEFNYTPSGTAGAADYFEIANVQLEEGSFATPFRRNSSNLQAELAACQRYYCRLTGPTGTGIGYGICVSSAASYTTIHFPVPMRVPPTLGSFSNLIVTDRANYDLAITAYSTTQRYISNNSMHVNTTHNAGGASTRFHHVAINNPAGFIEFNAEL